MILLPETTSKHNPQPIADGQIGSPAAILFLSTEKIEEGKEENLAEPKQQSRKRQGEEDWTLATMEIFNVSPVNCLPITGLGDSISPLVELSASTPGVFQIKTTRSGKTCISPCKMAWSVDSYAPASSDRVSIQTPDQLHRTVLEVAADDRLEEHPLYWPW